MRGNRGYRDDWRRSRWRDRCDGRGLHAIEELLDLAQQAGLWAAGCLAVASLAPGALVPVLLRELLWMAGFVVSIVGLWRGESLSLERFNRQDVALVLLALALVAGLFADPAALEAFMQAQATATAAAAI